MPDATAGEACKRVEDAARIRGATPLLAPQPAQAQLVTKVVRSCRTPASVTAPVAALSISTGFEAGASLG